MSSAIRYLLCASGLLLGIPFLFVLYLSPGLPISRIGIVYLVGYILIVLGLISAPWSSTRALPVSLAGIVILLVSISIRSLFPASGSEMNLITLPGPSQPRLLTRIFDEQDIVLFGAKVAPSVGFVSLREYDSLIAHLSQTYQEMNIQGVTTLSPALPTYLGRQQPGEFDALVSEPPAGNPETGLLFLHGYGGNFTLQCWLVAKAANEIGAITLCPSTDPSGQWWTGKGAAILEESIAYLHQRGVRKIYLAGLSNGGIGASRLADRFKDDLAGLILISGADPAAAGIGLPVLLIHGRSDERIPASIAQEYASISGPSTSLQLLEGDHFVLLKEAEQVQAAVINWLSEQHN